DYDSALKATTPAQDSGGARRLTHDGFVVSGPRFVPPPCSGCPQDIVYSVRTPHGFPALRRIAADGSRSRQIATRYLGSTAAPVGPVLLFDQQDLRRSVGLYSDLYALEMSRGRARRLTADARLIDPDGSPIVRNSQIDRW